MITGFKPYTIGFITDPTLSRERTQIALRAVSQLRETADVRFLPGNLEEDELLARIRTESFDLLLAPWHLYLHYQKIEAHFGLARLGGPTMVGYFAEDLSPAELSEEDHHFRAILIDLNRLASKESGEILKLFLRDSTRWGIKPLLMPSTLVHYETWSAQVGLGFRMDTVLGLSEISNTNWKHRMNSIRMLITALWSLVFDHGPGRRDGLKNHNEREARAYFEFGADSTALVFRLCYHEPGWKVKDVLHQFWPGALSPSHAGQIIGQFADLLRVHVDPETSEIEVTAVLYPSAPSERAADIIKSIWIEPLSGPTRLERFYESDVTLETYHRPLITHHELIGNAVEKIDELKSILRKKEEMIKELTSKGNITETVFVYPNGRDNDQILQLFGKKAQESRTRVQSLHEQLNSLQADHGHDENRAQRLIREIKDLALLQKNWVIKLKSLIEAIQENMAPNFSPDEFNKAPNPLVSPIDPAAEEEAAIAVAGTQTRQPKKRRATAKKAS
jgi:hypothetical protein